MSRAVGRFLEVLAVLAPLMLSAACGGDVPSGVSKDDPYDGSLIGTWKGTVEGGNASNSYGRANVVMVLRADSTFSIEADNPLYCALNNAVWRVSGTQFSADGRDCTNVVVTFAADVPKTIARLSGTWTATSSRAGTFSVAKQ